MMKMVKSNKTALGAAIDILARRSYSIKILGDKLKIKGYEEDEIRAAIESLIKRGYLNDQELCQYMYRSYIESEHYSRRQIEAKLLQKGFAQSIINECRNSSDRDSEFRAAAKVLQSRYNTGKLIETAKLLKYLYSKGFASDAIRAAVAKFAKQPLPEEEFSEFD